MLAMTYLGPSRVKATKKPEPKLEHPNDVLLRVTRAAICGSDLHLYHGLIPDTRVGSTFGHEFVGVVEEVGPIPDDMSDEDVLLLTDVFPTGYQAAEMGSVREGDTVVVFGCGPVGLLAHRPGCSGRGG